MTPNELAKFRTDTKSHQKTAGIMLWNTLCNKCKLSKRRNGGKHVYIGKRRFFTCADCL